MGGPRVDQVDVGSQATPLAEDFLSMLQGQLSSGAFGTGVGPNQREAGTAIRQFIQSLQGGSNRTEFDPNAGAAGGLDRLISGLEAGSEARTERGAADLREQGGITGTRFGSSLAQGEALFRSESGANLDQLIGGLQEQGRQFDVGAREGARQFDIGAEQFDINALLAGIQELFGQGQANTDIFAALAGLGIFPDETIVSPSTTTQVVTGATGLVGAIRGGD